MSSSRDTMEPVAVAVAGAGYWGRNLVRNLHEMREATLVRVVDPSPGAQTFLTERYPGLEVNADYQAALAPDIEAVVLATPAPTHHELALRALEAGKHVFVEKPLALSVEHACELEARGREAERVLFVGHLMEYHPVLERIEELLQAGELGQLRYLYTQRVNLGIVRKDENALWSYGPHDVSMILRLAGQLPEQVAAWGASYLTPGVEDVVFLGLRFPGGVMSHSQMSWLDPHKVRSLVVVGSKKMAVFDDVDATEKLRIYDKGVDRTPEYTSFAEMVTIRSGDIQIPAIKVGEPLRRECLHFLRAVRGLEAPRTDGANGVRVVQVLAAASESLRQGGAPITTEPTT